MEEKDMTLVQRLSLRTEAVYESCGCNRDAIYADMKRPRTKYMRDTDYQTSTALFKFWKARV